MILLAILGAVFIDTAMGFVLHGPTCGVRHTSIRPRRGQLHNLHAFDTAHLLVTEAISTADRQVVSSPNWAMIAVPLTSVVGSLVAIFRVQVGADEVKTGLKVLHGEVNNLQGDVKSLRNDFNQEKIKRLEREIDDLKSI